MAVKSKMSNVRYRAVLKIEARGTEWEENTYGDKTAVASIDEKIIDIELSDTELNELVERVTAHLELVKEPEVNRALEG